LGRDASTNLLLAWLDQLELGNSLLEKTKAASSAIQNLANEGFEIENRILEGGA